MSWLYWLVIGLGLLAFEAATMTLFVGYFGISAVAASVAAAFGADLYIQLTIFAVGALMLLFSTRKMALNAFRSSSGRTPSSSELMIGKVGLLNEAIDGQRRGAVKIDGEQWTAFTADGSALPIDSKVKIVSVEGAAVTVEKV